MHKFPQIALDQKYSNLHNWCQKVETGGNTVHTETTVRLSTRNELLMPLHTRRNVHCEP